MTFGWELVVLHTAPSMLGIIFGVCLDVMWTFEQRTFYIGSIFVSFAKQPMEIIQDQLPTKECICAKKLHLTLDI
jgi:hypothetical protein